MDRHGERERGVGDMTWTDMERERERGVGDMTWTVHVRERERCGGYLHGQSMSERETSLWGI